MLPVVFEYLRESGGFDCSVDESYTLRLPANEIVASLGLKWSGNGADYLDAAGQLIALDPTAHANRPQTLLLREDSLKEFPKREKFTICWTIIGEKLVTEPGFSPVQAMLRLSGSYISKESGPFGFLKCILDERNTGNTGDSSSLHTTIRSPDQQ